MEIQTSADPAVLWLRALQHCYFGGHAPQSGETIGLLKKLKDGMLADLADSQKAEEKDRKADHAPLQVKENEVPTLTATFETNFQQMRPPSGDIRVEVDGLTGDLTETENHFSGDRASSGWEEEQIVAEGVIFHSR